MPSCLVTFNFYLPNAGITGVLGHSYFLRFIFCVWVFVCMHICVPYTSLVLVEVRGRHQIPWVWSYRQLIVSCHVDAEQKCVWLNKIDCEQGLLTLVFTQSNNNTYNRNFPHCVLNILARFWHCHYHYLIWCILYPLLNSILCEETLIL